MSKQFVGRVLQPLKAGDLVHLTLSDDGTVLESGELKFGEDAAAPVVEPTTGVIESELPSEEPSAHAEQN